MTLADLTVDIVPIVRSIAGKRRNPSGNLLQQGPTREPSSTSLLVSSDVAGYSRLMGADEEGGGLHAREVVASAHPL
jgi:hypothetical protein